MSRGQTVLVTFKKQYDVLPVEGCLFNEDPVSGTLFVIVNDKELLVIYRDHVESVQVLKGDKDGQKDEDEVNSENIRLLKKLDAFLDVNSLVLGLDKS